MPRAMIVTEIKRGSMEAVLLLTDYSPECLKAAEVLRWHDVSPEPVSSRADQFCLPSAMFKGAVYEGMTGIYALVDHLKIRGAVGN